MLPRRAIEANTQNERTVRRHRYELHGIVEQTHEESDNEEPEIMTDSEETKDINNNNV